MIQLHYAELNLNGDIPVYEFKTMDSLIKKALKICSGKITPEAVFLLTYEYEGQNENVTMEVCPNTEIFFTISKKFLNIYLQLIKDVFDNDKLFRVKRIFLQEYPSFEDAYDVALNMQEATTNLCYSEDDRFPNLLLRNTSN